MNSEMNFMFLDLNGSYLPYLYVLITSILKNHENIPLHFYVGYVDTPQQNREELENYVASSGNKITFIHLDLSLFDGFMNFGKAGIHNYKILPHMILPESIDRVLIMDTDTIAVDNLSGLYNIEFTHDELFAAAVGGSNLDEALRYTKNYEQMWENTPNLGVGSGVILANLKQLRKENFDLDKMLTYTNQPKSKLWEEAILVALRKRIKPLFVFEYNYKLMDHNKFVKFCHENNYPFKIYIRHYHIYAYTNNIFRFRPWELFYEDNEKLFYSDDPNINKSIQEHYSFWWKYAKMSPNYTQLYNKMLETKNLHRIANINFLNYTIKIRNEKTWAENAFKLFSEIAKDFANDKKLLRFSLYCKQNKKSIALIKTGIAAGNFVKSLFSSHGNNIIFSSEKAKLTDLSEAEWNICLTADYIISINSADHRDGRKAFYIKDIFGENALLSSDEYIDFPTLEETLSLTDKIKEAQIFKESFKDEIKTLQAEKDNLHKELGKLTFENNSLKDRYTQISEEKSALYEKILLVASEKDALISELRDLISKLNNNAPIENLKQLTQLQTQQLMQRIKELQDDKDKLSAEIGKINCENDHLKEKLRQSVEQHEALSDAHKALHAEYQSIQSERDQLGRELTRSSAETKQAKDALNAADQEIERLKDKLHQMENSRSWRYTRIFRKKPTDE